MILKKLYHFTDDNSNELIGETSLKMNKEFTQENGIKDQTDIINTYLKILMKIINNIVIKGIKDISDIIITENKSLLNGKS